jgi:2-oxoglutarate ferredoxin oxidoreductase subunit alpha
MTSEVIDSDTLEEPEITGRSTNIEDNLAVTLPTYGFQQLSDVPSFAPVGGSIKVTATGSAHNHDGLLKKNDPETIQVLHHLEEKIRHRSEELTVVKHEGSAQPEILVISYGVTARAASEAVQTARVNGIHAGLLHVQSLFPVPVTAILRSVGRARRIVVPEENLLGQYRSVISPYCGNGEVIGVNKIGSMITPGEILDAISRR